MKDPFLFHRIDFLRVALQIRGAKPLEIDYYVASLKTLARSPQDFDQWNCKLDEKETQLLGFMLTPGGEEVAVELIATFCNTIVSRFNITPEEMEAWWRPIREKLN